MNVSMQDAFNLGLETRRRLAWTKCADAFYAATPTERHAVAAELIAFDREWAAMFSAAPKRTEGDAAADRRGSRPSSSTISSKKVATPPAWRRSIRRLDPHCRGLSTRRSPAAFTVGMRFHSAPVIRLADAKPVQLGHTLKADGRWRLYLFVDRDDDARTLHASCTAIAELARAYTPPGADIDAVLDVRAVLQHSHADVDLGSLPALLRPAKGRFGLIDYEKVFCPDPRAGDIFDLRAIDRAAGCVVVVRPDQFVAAIFPLDASAALSSFFAGFMSPERKASAGPSMRTGTLVPIAGVA